MYMTVKQAAEKWGISDRRVRILCSEGKIPGITRRGRSWMIPLDARKPEDGRYKASESMLDIIDRKKRTLDSGRTLTEGEKQRLAEEFAIEYIYNSCALSGNTLTLRETDLVLQGLTVEEKSQKDQIETAGHKEALRFVRDPYLLFDFMTVSNDFTYPEHLELSKTVDMLLRFGLLIKNDRIIQLNYDYDSFKNHWFYRAIEKTLEEGSTLRIHSYRIELTLLGKDFVRSCVPDNIGE